MTTKGIEASTLGLKVGEWPVAIVFEGRTFRRTRTMRHGTTPDGEFAGFIYRAFDGEGNVIDLEVFND